MIKRICNVKVFLITITCCLSSLSHAQAKIDTAAKIKSLVAQMTLEEKVHMIHASSSFTSGGVPRLGIPEFSMSDGPHGVRPEHGRDWNLDNNSLDSGTYLPTGVCLAATWNPALGYEYGSVLGQEAKFRGKNIILGPGINIIRTALNGRNFEYESEDPYLISKMVVGYIKGVQAQGVSACVKHYLANNQELWRHTVDVQMSERALREIYLPGFKAAVQEGNVNTLMSSYNKFRGQWASQNYYLLTQILRKELGFKGVVMSDWDANTSTLQPLWNGLDLEMGTDLRMRDNPDYGKFWFGDTVVTLVKSGRFPEYLIDQKVKRILYVMYKSGMMNGKKATGSYNTKEHQQVAAQVAEEGIVLLKNESLLPLNKNNVKNIAVIGYNAERKQSMGGGSSQVRAFYEITPLKGLQTLAGNKININYSQGYEIRRGAKANTEMINQAAEAASKADVAIIVGGWTHGFNYSVWKDNAYDAEDFDKPDMKMPFGQDELINAVMKANPKTIIVLMGGGAIDMSQWVDRAPAILQAWYPGLEGGNALAKIIFGEVNPSGKLPMSFPKKLEDEPAHKLGQYPGDSSRVVHYFDDIYVGYRYYDTYKVEPQFAFGHGLSYTSFEYANLKITPKGNGATVSFSIKNSGKVKGAEIVQLYVKQEHAALPRPEKELKAFNKIFLEPGESKTVTMNLDENAFQYYSDIENKWVMENGIYNILIGSSSRNIRLTGKIKL
ncbi:MAG TPA: glycoside hydrolase family 3 C-terminal domain-containing protein [Chitinophagaceae bacterium]|nr:glycoside hydrolase family 3 C-terminal domain-containing protein [Chitinophagaceae bacterium]